MGTVGYQTNTREHEKAAYSAAKFDIINLCECCTAIRNHQFLRKKKLISEIYLIAKFVRLTIKLFKIVPIKLH